MAVNLSLSLRVDEGYVIGRDACCWTDLLVCFVDGFEAVASPYLVREPKGGQGGQDRRGREAAEAKRIMEMAAEDINKNSNDTHEEQCS